MKAEVVGMQKMLFDSIGHFRHIGKQTSLFIKQLEGMEDGWRIDGGMKAYYHKASGRNGGYRASCGQKSNSEMVNTVL